MKLWLAVVVVVFAASCAAPDRPEAWSVQRVTPSDDRPELTGVCLEVRDLALGAHGDETTLDGTLDALARIAATTGATAALPQLRDIGALEDDEALTEFEVAVQRHDLLVDAGTLIDDATFDECGIPGFSALYATTGFPECHFEMEIPIAAYTAAGSPGTCETRGRPDYLPCWSVDGGYLAVDCVTGDPVAADGNRWAPAGEPRVIEIERVDPDAEPGPELVVPKDIPECADLAALFETDAAAVSDFDRLADATASLDASIRSQVQDFLVAAADPPSLDEFEEIVAALDHATADACGLPLASAWASLTSATTELPCWTETGLRYPAFAVAECGETAS